MRTLRFARGMAAAALLAAVPARSIGAEPARDLKSVLQERIFYLSDRLEEGEARLELLDSQVHGMIPAVRHGRIDDHVKAEALKAYHANYGGYYAYGEHMISLGQKVHEAAELRARLQYLRAQLKEARRLLRREEERER